MAYWRVCWQQNNFASTESLLSAFPFFPIRSILVYLFVSVYWLQYFSLWLSRLSSRLSVYLSLTLFTERPRPSVCPSASASLFPHLLSEPSLSKVWVMRSCDKLVCLAARASLLSNHFHACKLERNVHSWICSVMRHHQVGLRDNENLLNLKTYDIYMHIY